MLDKIVRVWSGRNSTIKCGGSQSAGIVSTRGQTSAGFARLHKRFHLAPCSNGNIALMVISRAETPFLWDTILGSEIARDFKPKPQVYLAPPRR